MKKKIMVLLLASLALAACGQKKETEPSASSSQKQVTSPAKKSSSSKKAGNSTATSSSTEAMVESQSSSSQAESVSQEVSASSTQEEAAEATSGETIPAIQGTWSSAMGSITIEGGKLTNGTGTFTVKQISDGSWTLAEVVASPPVYYYVPAGQSLATSVRTYESDETRDRIFIQPQYDAPQEAFEPYIFYRN
ncbi:hypothetical protein JEQ21_07795 [Streptococcus sp. 121]|uniref:hypothetical protein n=1 Tax=Streptococcus sp. 121 TaxID=2797637 RepID=UPI0018F104B9|nr:hypothetical protein [Streptococcus sp. 121]MBJ6746356.1 hypothetical protein [Streptococcus sp. 121]